MKRYTLNENKGDIAYEVEDNLLTLKVRPEFVSSIPVGEGVYIIKTGDNTIPSDYNVLSAKRTMEEIEGAISGIKPAEQHWVISKTTEGGTELDESEWILTPKEGYSIYTPKNITATGFIAAGFSHIETEDPEAPIAGYEAIGYSKYDPEHFTVDPDGLVHIKDGAGGGSGEFKDLTLITSTSTDEPTDYNVYTALAVKKLLEKVDSKPSSLWVKDKTSEYLLLSDDGTTAKLLLPFDITGTLDVSGRISTKSDVAAEGAVWAGLKSTTVASNPVAGYEAIGMCRFDSSQFTVTNGYVQITGDVGGGTTSYWGYEGTGWAYAYLDGKDKQVSLYGHGHSALSFNYGSLTNTTNTSYDGTASNTVYIPTAVSHLTNDNGYIYDATNTTSPIKYLSNSGINTQYLNGLGSFATIPDTHLSHDPSNTIYVDTYSNQNIAGQKWFTGNGSVLIGPTNNVHIQLGLGSGNCIHGLTKTGAMGNLYFNYNSDSSFIKCDPNDNFIASGSIIAGATSDTYSSNNFPTAGTSAKGMCYFDSTQFSVTSAGMVSIRSGVISGGGGSTVSVSPITTSGTQIATITVDGDKKTLYAPSVVGVGSVTKTTNNTGSGQANTISVKDTNGKEIGTFTVNNGAQGATGKVWQPSYDSSSGLLTWSLVSTTANPGSANIRGGSISKVEGPSSVNTNSSAGNKYTCYVGSVNVGSFTVYNGAKGASGTTTVNGLSGGTISGSVTVSGSSYNYLAIVGGSTTWKLQVRSDSGSAYGLHFLYNDTHKATIKNTGAFYSAANSYTSDARLKDVYSKVTDVLDTMDKIDVVRFKFKKIPELGIRIGYIAQNVMSYYPETVDENDGYYGLDYSSLNSVAFQGVKELYSIVKTQRAQIDSLLDWRVSKEEEIKGLYQRIEALEALLLTNK